jgi:hypothetical protein
MIDAANWERNMTASRRVFLTGLASGGFGFLGGKVASAASPAPTAAQVQVDLFRGLADIFSRGMDTLAARLNREGYMARAYSTGGWEAATRRIVDQHVRQQRVIIVLIGHSLGANVTFDIANALDKHGIPVELIVTFDATSPRPVPKNVLHLVNFYQNNGFGKQVSAGPGFQGELTNIDLTADTGLSHTTIEKSPRLHAMVMNKIAEVVEKDLRNRMKTGKRKAAKPKS